MKLRMKFVRTQTIVSRDNKWWYTWSTEESLFVRVPSRCCVQHALNFSPGQPPSQPSGGQKHTNSRRRQCCQGSREAHQAVRFSGSTWNTQTQEGGSEGWQVGLIAYNTSCVGVGAWGRGGTGGTPEHNSDANYKRGGRRARGSVHNDARAPSKRNTSITFSSSYLPCPLT